MLRILLISLAVFWGLDSTAVRAEWRPTKEVKLIVPASPGGGSDQFVRQIAKAAEAVEPSVKMVVINISGGGGATGFTQYMGMEPDGHTYISVYPEIVVQLADGTLPFSAADIVPVMRAQNGPATILARGDETRFKTYDEMIAFMKKNNVQLVAATYTLTGFDDVSLRAIEEKEGVSFKRVPFVRAGERFAAVMGGHVDLLTQRIGDVVKFIEGKRMTPIIADVPRRLDQYPGMPTFKEKNVPFELGYWRGIWARKGVPAEAIAYMDTLLRKAMRHPSYAEYEKKGYYDLVEGYLDHKAFAESVKRELAVYSKVYAQKSN
jgi:tripartite-type tricarboxylate transporter receptor subunit TctC